MARSSKKKSLDEEVEEQSPTQTVLRPLSAEEIDERAHELAEKIEERDRLTEKKADDARKMTAKIRVVSAKITKLAREVSTGQTEVEAQVTLDEAIKSRRNNVRPLQDRGAAVEP